MTVERFFINEAKKAYDIEDFLKKQLDVAGFSHAEVKKTPLGTRIIIHALRPGLVIGASGENIKRLTAYVGSKFGVENPHLEVEQVREAFLDPHIVAWRMARSLEKGAYFKRAANITVSRIMQAGAKGVEIRLSGKLPSARSKTWKFISGKLRKCGQEAVDQVQVAYAKAMTKPGIVGVRVAILPPDAKFSDLITTKYVEPKKAAPEAKDEEIVEVPEAPEVDEKTEKILEKVIKEETQTVKDEAKEKPAKKEIKKPAKKEEVKKDDKKEPTKKENKPAKKEAKTSPQKG